MEHRRPPACVFALLVAFLSVFLLGCTRQQKEVPRDSGPPPDQRRADALPFRLFPTAHQALEQILKARPRVIGFGEYHQKTDSAKVRSALSRFTQQLIEPLANDASDLIVETWIAEGGCGGQEQKVVKKVERTTQRPAATESELIRMLKKAKQAGIQPHILKVSCEDYDKLLWRGKLDHEQLLSLITRHLQRKTLEVLKQKANSPKDAQRTVAIYGGALHNDLYPIEELKDFTYAAALKKLTDDRYIEVDLYVPEFVEGDKHLSQELWYPIMKQRASHKHVVLIERGVASYILILRKGLKLYR